MSYLRVVAGFGNALAAGCVGVQHDAEVLKSYKAEHTLNPNYYKPQPINPKPGPKRGCLPAGVQTLRYAWQSKAQEKASASGP